LSITGTFETITITADLKAIAVVIYNKINEIKCNQQQTAWS